MNRFSPISVGLICLAAVICTMFMAECGKEHAHKTSVIINSGELRVVPEPAPKEKEMPSWKAL